MTENAKISFRQALNLLRKKPPKYQQAIPLLQTAAEAGEPEAAFQLGGCYIYGLGVEANRGQATYWIKLAADSGHTLARYNLALIREGNGADFEHLLPSYDRLAEEGFLPAQIRLMDYFAEHKQTDLALYWAQQAAKQQHPNAQYYLARNHQNSERPNLLAAHELFKQAAAQGFAYAHWQLANQYHYGQGTEANPQKALYHFQAAAEAGIAAAQSKYAKLLLSTPTLPAQQITEAVKWLTRAAKQNDAEAHAQLAQLYLTGRHVHRDQETAYQHASAAAKHNHPDALRMLGDIHRYGMGVPEDQEAAHSFYQRAAKQGDIAAHQKLLLADALKKDGSGKSSSKNSAATIEYHRRNEKIYQEAFAKHYGLGCKQDYTKALSLYQEAATYHHPKAQTNLGMMYYNGQGVKTDPARAAYWFEQAANAGDNIAQYNIACLYYHGYGVEQNRQTACHWLEAAINNGHDHAEALKPLLQSWQSQ